MIGLELCRRIGLMDHPAGHILASMRSPTLLVSTARQWLILGLFVVVNGTLSCLTGALFESDEPIHLRIEGPFTTLADQQDDDLVWVDGQLTVIGDDGVESVFSIRLKGRGMTRRDPDICSFPPYWIDFKKKEIKGTLFAGHERMKVVTHCRDSRSFDQFVYREYLTYRTYNCVSDQSFRVQLLNIEYVDTDRRKKKTRSRPAFFLEHLRSVAARLNGEVVRVDGVFPAQFDPVALKRAEVLEYLVGNTDFNFVYAPGGCCHNSKVLFFDPSESGYIPLPYDFDLAGLVNPPYAKPHPKFEIRRVTQRLFRGTQSSEEIWSQTRDLYLESKDEILEMWATFPYLNRRHRREALRFLDGFFVTLENPSLMDEYLVSKARDPDGIAAFVTRKTQSPLAEPTEGDTVTESPQ